MAYLRQLLLSDLPIRPHQLNRLIVTAPHRYKIFFIPKKKKGEMRLVAQPAKEVKVLQRWLVNHCKDKLPVHSAAVAYQDGKGIKFNAEQHKNNKFVLKMDFQEFFYSIEEKDLRLHFLKYFDPNIAEEDLSDICKILLWTSKNNKTNSLCIGAPSSPFISNSVMFEFDTKVFELAQKAGVVYTRYADDLTFSTNLENKLADFFIEINNLVKDLHYPKLKINASKTVHTSRKHGIRITGVVVTPDRRISLGRDRKRMISSSVHHFLLGDLSKEKVRHLNGLLAFAHDVEPLFIIRLKAKYGTDFWQKIIGSSK